MAGEDPDFDEFVRSNLDGLVRAPYMLVWDLREAEDLVQDCLLKVARSWARVGVMDSPLGYTRRVLIHLALRQAGRRARRRAELEVRAVERGTESLTGLGMRQDLIEAVAVLPPRQRAVIVLRYFLDLSVEETARALGCSTGTVKNSGFKGLARLREAFTPDPPCTEVSKR